MSYPRVTASYQTLEQGAATLAGGGANVDAVFTKVGAGTGLAGAFARFLVLSTVAAFARINGTPATNSAGATGFPLPANVPVTFEGPITSASFNGATGGTVAWVGYA